ncbi:hypothetical protein GCM10008927_10880 [Amylibacter ulvae]|uniref:Amino acid adenylation domain-containing protein n=1 Tax=Paramylibacter ulvae TaxID=1651968 RepID=A0ABQ3D0P6_9RHOB|nr:non-ribosomal peptide synthetase/type I polyketide synthase [Amylibacter ulvae]GHA47767.1 hypothetical protein GCM10008927_10880 [Amylibacter ulvae]
MNIQDKTKNSAYNADVITCFQKVVKKSPKRTALESGDLSINYAQLDRASNIVAQQLLDAGAKQGDLIGLSCAKSPETIIAILAILKLGAGYVPLPDYYPADRIATIVDATGMTHALGSIDALAKTDVNILPFLAANQIPTRAKKFTSATVAPDDTAYVMFTSGSTGTPKGVVVPHRAITRLVIDQNFMVLDAKQRILQNSPLAFDAATLEIWGAILNGGALIVPQDDNLTLRGLGEILRDKKITATWLTAGLFHAMADERPADLAPLKQLLTGGDIVSPVKAAVVRKHCPHLVMINGYGPTENTTFTCCHTITDANMASDKPLPIGKPISGTQVYIVDETLNQLPLGQSGELVCAGAGLALGYLNRSDLTEAAFVTAPWDNDVKLYRTGDMAHLDKEGNVIFEGRIDTQVKVRGYRVELGEIEAGLEAYEGINSACVIAKSGADSADKTIIAFYVGDKSITAQDLQKHIAGIVPDYAIPSRFVAMDELPLNPNGKLDRKGLATMKIPAALPSAPKKSGGNAHQVENLIADVFAEILQQPNPDRHANFFDLGASSLHIARAHERIETNLDRQFAITDFFLHSTITALATHLAADPVAVAAKPKRANVDDNLFAIVGMAGRYPGANSVDEYWNALLDGRELISHFSDDELEINPRAENPNAPYVNSRGMMPDVKMFDARHFGIPPREAEQMDPQHRILLEVAQTALEDAKVDPDKFDGKIGIFCGSSQNSYLLNNLMSAPGATRKYASTYPVENFGVLFGNDKDFIATRIAYKLNLRGPAATVLCACSTSLVAVAQACESLRNGTADMALAGGVSITLPSKRPYQYLPDGMASADGHCRTFDADASGTVFGDGAGLVVVRRLQDAIDDGDDIVAVIRGFSINNDGSEKVGYAAPSIKAQAEVIKDAQAAAGIDARSIGYIEAHGTGTPLGDPIEFAALNQAFSASTSDKGFCAIGSAKTNVGHLDIAAGVTGLIKTAMTLKTGQIPPLLHYKSPNKNINFDDSAFYPVTKRIDWKTDAKTPRRAGISAFGVGGTNIHMILEQPPVMKSVKPPKLTGPQIFPVSASSKDALKATIANLGAFAKENGKAAPAAIIQQLLNNRHDYNQRAVLVGDGMNGLSDAADNFSGVSHGAGRWDKIAMMFPGQGAQHVGMAKDLYENETVFREALDICAALLKDETGIDLLKIIHAPAKDAEKMTEKLKDTAIAQPAIFSISYALAKQWAHWGVNPDAMMGHSIGEFAAATIAGIFALPDAIKLIALRGRLMADLPRGVMISVRASENDILPYLGDDIDLAAVNGAQLCVISGPKSAGKAATKKLEDAGFVCSELHTSHAFHSHMMDPALDDFRAVVSKMELNAPRIPIMSTVTGDWLTEIEATDPDYWAMHMRRPVRFFDAMQRFWAEGTHVMLESGPGRTLATLAGQNPDRGSKQPALSSLPHAQSTNANSHTTMLESFGNLWAVGYSVDWTRIYPDMAGWPIMKSSVTLPSYPFQRKEFWIDPVIVDATAVSTTALAADEPVVESAPVERDANIAVKEMLSELSGLDVDEIDDTASYLELGFDSLLLTQATKELSDQFSVTVTLRQLMDDLARLDLLVEYVREHGNLGSGAPADKTPLAEMTQIDKGEEESATPSSAPTTNIDREDHADELNKQQRAHIAALTKRFVAKTQKSKDLTAKHRFAHADPRTASGFNRLWKEIVYQIVTVKSKGSRLLDVDGNEYIDILNGFGPGFLGHGADNIVEAVQHQLHEGFEVGPQSLAAMEAAELFCEVTGNDRTSFVCTGSEAVYAAMRLARTCTGRDKVVMFARDYHGNFDEVLVRGVNTKSGPKTMPLAPGIPRDAVKNVVVLPYGSPEALDYIKAHAHELAAVMVEPVQSRRPEFRPHDFIRTVRKLTRDAGALFIFDEVVTGFRFGPRGAQDYYGIDADLVTYGKVIGGGMPLGVVSGKAEYMDTFDGGQWQYGDDSFPNAPVTFFAGTFVRHPLAMASVKAMLQFFKSQPDFFWKTVNAKGDKLAGSVDKWFADNDMPFQMPNCGSLMYLRIGEDQKYGGLLGANMRERGVFFLEGFPSYMTAAHDDEDIEYVVDAIKDSALELRAAGLLVGREAVEYDGPRVSAPPARLALPDGAERIAHQMANPPKTLRVPTTEAQREIWAAMIVTPEVTPAYNESVTLKMHGVVDAQKLREATETVFARHDALRTTFSPDGMFMQISPTSDVQVLMVDMQDLTPAQRKNRFDQIILDEVNEPFDMQSGPFVRAQLISNSKTDHNLIITAHHIVCDGWSIDVIMRDIGAVYSALMLGENPSLPPAQSIISYSRAEEEWNRTEEAAQSRAYWLNQFEQAPPVLDIPTDKPRGAQKSVRGARADREIDAALTARLRKLAASQNSTFVNTLLAAYKIYIAKLADVDDITIGLPASGQAARGMDTVVGHCVNLLPIRTQIDWDDSFETYLKHVRTTLLDGFEHQNYTFGALIKELKIKRDPSRVMLVPAIFNIDNGIDLSSMSFGDVDTEFVTNPRSYEHFEIYLNVTDNRDTVYTEWSYAADLFDAATIERHITNFIALLDQLCDHPDQALNSFDTQSDADRKTLLNDWQGAVVDYPRDTNLGAMFDKIVAKSPGMIALAHDGHVKSYSDLDNMVNAIAGQMHDMGVKQGDTVGICLHRSFDLVATMLAAFRLGAAYVPLAPNNPKDRLDYMASDARCALVVSTHALAKTLPFDTTLFVDDVDRSKAKPIKQAKISATDTAYVAYTSGSTGRPKGVMGTHRATINRFNWMWNTFPFEDGEVMCQKTAISFVDSIWEIFGPLLAGVPQVIIDDDTVKDPAALFALLGAQNVTRLLVVPSLLRAILNSKIDMSATCPNMRLLFTSGERLGPDLARRFLDAAPNITLVNLYGSSEVAADVTCEIITELGDHDVPIGRPIDNARLYVLGKNQTPVQIGEMGELYVGGDVLAAGYFNQPELTDERFVPDPFVDGDGMMFATGDLVRYLSDGRLLYEGRRDDQVKIRGYRIEMGEVEQALADLDDVAQAAVILGSDINGENRMEAYVTTSDNAVFDESIVRRALSATLPDYMVPSLFHVLDVFPLNPNGKLDRPKLAEMALAKPATTADARPDSDVEKRLHDIWADVLGRKNISLDDNFFELGGHSLLAVKLFSNVQEEFGQALPISTLFANPTLRKLATTIDDTTSAPATQSDDGVNDAWDTSVIVAESPNSTKKPLFVVGGVGGNLNNMYEFAQLIGQHRTVIGLQTRGILHHKPHNTVEAMATDHINNMRQYQPTGPYYLAGYSGGAIIAFEIAKQLEAAGHTIKYVGMLDMHAPNVRVDLDMSITQKLRAEAELLSLGGAKNLWRRASTKARNALAKSGLTPSQADDELQSYLRLSRHWWAVADKYHAGQIDADVVLFHNPPETLSDLEIGRRDASFGWQDVTRGTVDIIKLDSSHLDMFKGESAKIVAELINAHLEGLDAR